MSKVERYFRMARQLALKGDTKEVNRQYRFGAVGVRNDGTIVTSTNIPSRDPARAAHAEARLLRKLSYGSEVYVARILRCGVLANAKPCRHCETAMRQRGVRKCYYSISEVEYGVLRL
jgi:tRNA(Arg) A34 adenosine deaminase TadA